MQQKLFFKEHNNLVFDVNNDEFNFNTSKENILRYFKGIYSNKERFISRFIDKIKNISNNKTIDDLKSYLVRNFDKVEPFTYEEAFNLGDDDFQRFVFDSIDITDMIKNLGCERINVKGTPVKRKQFDNEGNFIGYKEYDNIYETYKVNGEKLGLTNDDLFALKVWCTSTNKEHWLWIEEKYKDDPLEAVASTFRIHKNLIPHIKELKRQGDIIFVELNQEVEPEGEIVPLTAKQYFELLTAES